MTWSQQQLDRSVIGFRSIILHVTSAYCRHSIVVSLLMSDVGRAVLVILAKCIAETDTDTLVLSILRNIVAGLRNPHIFRLHHCTENRLAYFTACLSLLVQIKMCRSEHCT